MWDGAPFSCKRHKAIALVCNSNHIIAVMGIVCFSHFYLPYFVHIVWSNKKKKNIRACADDLFDLTHRKKKRKTKFSCMDIGWCHQQYVLFSEIFCLIVVFIIISFSLCVGILCNVANADKKKKRREMSYFTLSLLCRNVNIQF